MGGVAAGHELGRDVADVAVAGDVGRGDARGLVGGDHVRRGAVRVLLLALALLAVLVLLVLVLLRGVLLGAILRRLRVGVGIGVADRAHDGGHLVLRHGDLFAAEALIRDAIVSLAVNPGSDGRLALLGTEQRHLEVVYVLGPLACELGLGAVGQLGAVGVHVALAHDDGDCAGLVGALCHTVCMCVGGILIRLVGNGQLAGKAELGEVGALCRSLGGGVGNPVGGHTSLRGLFGRGALRGLLGCGRLGGCGLGGLRVGVGVAASDEAAREYKGESCAYDEGLGFERGLRRAVHLHGVVPFVWLRV